MSQELAERLEDYASSRADFRELSTMDRRKIARLLTIARSQVDVGGGSDRDMIMKRSQFFYACGDVGIDYDEAKSMWWSYVYESPPPVERGGLI